MIKTKCSVLSECLFISGNVVWLDETSCARALLGVSKPLNSSNVEKAAPSEVQGIYIVVHSYVADF